MVLSNWIAVVIGCFCMLHVGENKPEKRIEEYLSKRAPGFLVVLNSAAQRVYGVTYSILLLRSPSSAYKLLRELYGGRADTAARLLIAVPLAYVYGRATEGTVVNQILELVKRGDDAAILDLIGLAPQSVRSISSLSFEKKVFQEILSCGVEVEKLAAEVYAKLARHFEEPFSSTLRYISVESSAHAQVYMKIYHVLYGDYSPICGRTSSVWFINKLREIAELLSKSKVNKDVLIEKLKFLAAMENDIDAEYFMVLVSPLLPKVLQEPYRSIYEPLLEAITRDEEDHKRIINSIITVLAESN